MERINELYMDWLNEQDFFIKKKKKEELIRNVSAHDLLLYSVKFTLPFNIFRDIFSLQDLFKTLEEMDKNGEDISNITNKILLVESVEDIKALSQYSQKSTYVGLKNLNVKIQGGNIFAYGNAKSIGRKFQNAYVNFIDIETIEKLMLEEKEYKGIPVIITIDNMGELPLDKLSSIENRFDVIGIRIIEKRKTIHNIHTQNKPVSVDDYKRIRTIIDNDYLNKLYVFKGADKTTIDTLLSTQIINMVVDNIEFAHNWKDKQMSFEEFAREYSDVSSIMVLLTKKAICRGYSEVIRNILSCVYIKCNTVLGETSKGANHAWNQIQLGEKWFNVDVTNARNEIKTGKPSGLLFMSDVAFFGDYRTGVFNQGQDIEVEAITGGHKRAHDNNCEECSLSFPPYYINRLLEDAKKYQEAYKENMEFEGVIPYVGSSIEKMRRESSKDEQGIII